jgi:hypothetical protein
MPQILNVAPILFESSTISVEKIPFTKELFDQLHITHRKTHFIKRTADSMFLVPLHSESPPYGGEKIEINLKEDLSLSSSLAREAMFRELLKLDCWLYNIKPIGYLIMRKDLLERSLPANITFIPGLSVFEKWEIDFRVIDPFSSGPFVSMSLNISTAPRVSIGCASLRRRVLQ